MPLTEEFVQVCGWSSFDDQAMGIWPIEIDDVLYLDVPRKKWWFSSSLNHQRKTYWIVRMISHFGMISHAGSEILRPGLVEKMQARQSSTTTSCRNLSCQSTVCDMNHRLATWLWLKTIGTYWNQIRWRCKQSATIYTRLERWFIPLFIAGWWF